MRQDRPALRHREPRSVGLVLPILLAALTLSGCASGSGDYNGDGITDMAVGIPFKDVGEISDAGAVMVLYGDPATGRPETAGGQLIQRPAPVPEAEPELSNEDIFWDL